MTWESKQLSDPDAVQTLLNGQTGHSPVGDAKISVAGLVKNPLFQVFYLPHPKRIYPLDQKLAVGKWGWKKATDIGDVLNFLTGQGNYQTPVQEARICGRWTGNYNEFYIFYIPGKKGQPPEKWGWHTTSTEGEAVDFLNGFAPGYPLPVKRAEIVALNKAATREFHIFYQNGVAGQPRDNWSVASCSKPDKVKSVLNLVAGPYPLPHPVRDHKTITPIRKGQGFEFLLFKPQGFLIVTRALFLNVLDDFTRWKESMGFEVYTLTAEWIEDHVVEKDIRFKIRQCLRDLYYNADVKYAVLIGDSVDVKEPYPPPPTYQDPPPPALTEAWNLPAGYYQWPVWTTPQYSTLFYADLTNKTVYTKNDPGYAGDYKIYVGVIPVRSAADLQCVLTKTMNAAPANQLTFVFSSDNYNNDADQQFQEIKSLAGPSLALKLFVFDSLMDTTGTLTVYSALFEREGIICERGHGNLNQFVIGGNGIENADAAKFQNINPLYLTPSCYVAAYHLGDCLDEAFLRTPKGPAAVTNGPPGGGGYAPGKQQLSILEAGFWQDLFAGKTIGQAFHDHCLGAGANPLHLFGDPSLVVMK